MDLLEQGIFYKNESYQIIGACIEVHSKLGCGFLEAVYQEALALEFMQRMIPFEAEKRLQISYKGQILNKEYIADFLCYKEIIIEVKALSKLLPEHLAQTMNYLKITDCKLCILVNFGSTSLQYKRVVL